ncbi:S4 domain-containing protein YaaA [Streptococcus macacae]|uniref:S4 domain protein YaaA n=1 Tax=Streptococcus macacae NCTC 11558 TaxID=764298 RepID=G5JXJ0_9STRE|nr:S4 domain-containing protein YaaA [Streptococcus macacae]EHJ53194.1 S4 domain protein YaaA [Streptococcus macacae NCTC 11558]SUN79764.1 S4 domain-containing protein YaaA [Streptococcus macacae NCTC 11558]
MEYKLFDDYITLQALLKSLSLISSGGAVKSYLAHTEVFLNGQIETRRGKKLRIGDNITIPEANVAISISSPTPEEKEKHLIAIAEKEKVKTIVKKMNKANKKNQKNNIAKKPIKFPGT